MLFQNLIEEKFKHFDTFNAYINLVHLQIQFTKKWVIHRFIIKIVTNSILYRHQSI